MKAVKKSEMKKAGHWYEKYLPFIARSPEKQIEWIAAKLRKKTLSYQEITPYVKLLLEEDDPEGLQNLRLFFARLQDPLLAELLFAADIYDTPKLLGLIPTVTIEHAVIAMGKTPPPYESSPAMAIDKVFETLHGVSDSLLKEGAGRLRQSGNAPPHFEESFRRFQEVLKDQEFLTTLYPKARG